MVISTDSILTLTSIGSPIGITDIYMGSIVIIAPIGIDSLIVSVSLSVTGIDSLIVLVSLSITGINGPIALVSPSDTPGLIIVTGVRSVRTYAKTGIGRALVGAERVRAGWKRSPSHVWITANTCW